MENIPIKKKIKIKRYSIYNYQQKIIFYNFFICIYKLKVNKQINKYYLYIYIVKNIKNIYYFYILLLLLLLLFRIKNIIFYI